jgi:uncharacterized protein (UPF0276 family)
MLKDPQAAQEGPDARRRLRAAREAYSPYVERAAEGANEAAGPFSAACTGIGLRAPHVGEIMASRPALPWLEVHPENYMGGGPQLVLLERVRREYPISLHGVGLSLGTAGDLDRRHLARLRDLVARIEPCLVSEHLSWSIAGGVPQPFAAAALYRGDAGLFAVMSRTRKKRSAAGSHREPVRHMRHDSPIPEPELAELAAAPLRPLCDVNNIFVTANLGLDAAGYLDASRRRRRGDSPAGHTRTTPTGSAS